jgi:hypothetical protein
MARFGNINEFTYFFLLSPDEMLCTMNIIVFSLVNSFPIMLSGEVQCPCRWLRHYTLPDNTIGEQFPQERTLIE